MTLTVLFLACSSPPEPSSDSQPAASGDEIERPPLAAPEPAWIDGRVKAAEERLAQTEAGQLIAASIEAHGGLHTWFSNGPLRYRFDYRPVGDKPARDTRQLVDPWSSRAVHELSDDPTVRFGWDGKQAWTVVPEGKELSTNARFWALTPYYFVAIPFVFADDGVILEALGTETVEDVAWDTVKVSYEDGTGDAPDDYYVAYLHPDDHHVGAVRYVVSYPGFFPDGGHSPEKWMAYDGNQTVKGTECARSDGQASEACAGGVDEERVEQLAESGETGGAIRFPETYRTFRWVDGAKGEHVTDVTLSEVSFDAVVLDKRFAVPEGATVLEGY